MTGRALTAQAIHRSLVRGIAESLGVAVLAVLIMLCLFLRAPGLALLSLVPNLMPLLWVLGVMGAMGVALKISTSVVFTIAFGIAVDDSVHWLTAYRHRRARLGSAVEAAAATVRETGTAMVITTLILAGGFSVLLASAFRTNRYLGALTALTLVLALICDMVLLPALLSWRDRRATKSPPR
jgi:predicted RND superfamily exporter protein